MRVYLILLSILILGFFVGGLWLRFEHKNRLKERNWLAFIQEPAKDLVEEIGNYTFEDSSFSYYPTLEYVGRDFMFWDERLHLIVKKRLTWSFLDTSQLAADVVFDFLSNKHINFADKLDSIVNPIQSMIYFKGKQMTVYKHDNTQIIVNTDFSSYIGKPLKLLLSEFPLHYNDRYLVYPLPFKKAGKEWTEKNMARVVINYCDYLFLNVWVEHPSPEDVLHLEACAPMYYSPNSRNFDTLEQICKAKIIKITDFEIEKEKEILSHLETYKKLQIHFSH